MPLTQEEKIGFQELLEIEQERSVQSSYEQLSEPLPQQDTTLSDMEAEIDAKVAEENQAIKAEEDEVIAYKADIDTLKLIYPDHWKEIEGMGGKGESLQLIQSVIDSHMAADDRDWGEQWGQGLQNLIRAGANIFDMADHINRVFGTNGKHKRLFGGKDYKTPIDYGVVADSIRAAVDKMDIKQPTGTAAEKPEHLHEYLTDPGRFANLVITNAPTTAALAMTTVVAPFTAVATMFAIEGGATAEMIRDYEEGTGRKLDSATAALAPFVVGSINAALEKTGIDAILASYGGGSTITRALKKILFTAGIEGGTEGLQEVNQIVAQFLVTNNLDPDYAHRIVSSAVAGLGSGGGIAAPGAVGGTMLQKSEQARRDRIAAALPEIKAEDLIPEEKKPSEAAEKPTAEKPPPAKAKVEKPEPAAALPEEKVKTEPVEPEKPAAEEEPGAVLAKYPVESVPVKDIKVSPEDFQFKKDVDERGIQRGTEIRGEYQELAAGNILVWQAKDGAMFVVNGHHRLAKARDEDQTHINTQIIKETDGYTKADAMNLGAITNIQEGRGTPYDLFEFFKGSEIPEAEVKKRGVEGKVWTLAQVAGDDLAAAFRNRAITPEEALTIAEVAGTDEAAQAVGMRLIQTAKEKGQQRILPDELGNQIQANIYMKKNSKELETVQDLFGDTHDAELQLSENLAKIASRHQRELKEQILALRVAKKEKRLDILKKVGLEFKSVAEALEALRTAELDLEKWKKWASDPELRKIILDELKGGQLEFSKEQEEEIDEQVIKEVVKTAEDFIDSDVKVTEGDLTIVEPSEPVHKAASTLAAIFGQKAIFVKIKSGSPLASYNGFATEQVVTIGGKPEIVARIVLNIDSPNNHLAVTGHEILHRLKAEAPDLYGELDKILRPQVQDIEKSLKVGHYPTGKLHEEIYGDLLGERMLDEEFWNKMAHESPSLVRKIAEILKKIITTITRSPQYSAGVHFKDLQKAYNTLDSVMKKYQARTKLQERAVRAVEKDIELSFNTQVDPLMQSKVKTEPLFKTNMEAIDYLLDQYHSNFDEEYQAANSEAALLQDQLKATLGTKTWGKAETELEQAIQLYIDLKNAEFETGESPQEQFEKWQKEPTDEHRKIFELSQNLTEDQIFLAEKIIELNRESGEQAKDDAIIGSTVHDYTMRLWETDKPEQELATMYGKFKLKSARARHRTLESMLEGWSQGKELRIKGAITARQVMTQQIAMVKWQRQLLQQARSLGLAATKPKDDSWVRLEHPNMKEWKWVKKLSEEEMEKRKAEVIYDRDLFITEDGNIFKKSDMFAEPEFGAILNKIFGTSSLLTGPGVFKDFMRALTRFNAELKHTVLTTSFFHHQAFLRSYWFGGRDNIFKAFNPLATVNAVRAGKQAVKNFTPEVRELVRGGLTIGRIQDFEEKLNQEQTRISKIVDKIGGLKQTKDAILQFRDWQTHILFNVMGPGLKVQAALLDYRHQLKKHKAALKSGEITKHEIATAVADELNADFGGMHLQRMRRDPTLQHIFRLAALAPDWTESNIRTMHKLFTADPLGRSIYRGFWYNVISKSMTMTVLFNILMSAFDDEDFFERYRKAWEAGNLRWLDADITPIWKTITGGDPENPDKRMYFSILGHFRDPIKFVIAPGKSAKHKGSIIARIAFDFFTGEDWAGRRFTTLQELLGIDDKGRYKTSRKGKYIKGQKKGGKLAGQVVTWTTGPKGHTSWAQMPSFLISTLRGSALPIWGQNLIGFLVGEMDGFFAAGKGAGFMISQTYPKKEEGTARDRLKARAARSREAKRR